MSGYNTNNIGSIGSIGSQQGPHDTGTEQPYPLNDGPFGAIRYRLAGTRAVRHPGVPSPPINQYDHHASNDINDSFNPHQQGMDGTQMAPNNNQSGSQVIPDDLINPQSQVPFLDFQYLNGGDQLPACHTNNSGYTVNPQIPAHYRDDSTLIDHDQVPQWPVHHTNSHSFIMNPRMPAYQHVEGTPITHGQQLPQLPVHHGHTANPQVLAYHQIEATPTSHNQQPQLPINSNQHQAQDLSYPFQNASTHFDQPLPLSVYATDYHGHDISQQALVHFPVGGTPAHYSQLPQMPINQTNFNGINNNQQAYQGMVPTAVSSFANLSVQEQNAEFQHFVQQRFALGDTKLIEFEIFKRWYIGQQLNGNIIPTLGYRVTPLHHALILNNNVPIQQPMIPPNNQEFMQPSTMIYQNTESESTAGFQYTMAPPTTLSIQAMRSSNEPYLQQPRTSINAGIRKRRTSLAIASAGQSFLPVSSPSMARPVLSITTTMSAPPSTTERPAPPSITRAQAPPSTTGLPAVTRRNRKLKNEDAQQMENKTYVTGKNNSQEQKTEATPATQRMSIPIDQIISSAGGKYTISLSDLPEVFVSDDTSDADLYNVLDREIEVMDMKAGKMKTKAYMLRNEESLAIVRMALGEILKQSIAHLSLDPSSDARQSFEHYATTRNIASSLIKSLAFAPESQFVNEEIKVVRGTEQTVRSAKDSVTVPATRTIMGHTINSDLNGTEVKGSYSLYTKTTFVGTTAPLKYAIGFEIQVAEVGDRLVRSGSLNYERSLPSNIVGEPLWADILDLLKLQTTEWDINTGIQDPPAYQTSTSISLSNQQKSDKEENGTEEQLPISGPVQGQRAQTRQYITPEPRRVRGEKRKWQQQPELHASPVIFKSSSEEPNSSSDHGNSPISNTSTRRTSISPQLITGEPRFSENSRPIKRLRNGYEMGLLEGGTGMKKSLPLRGQARLLSSMQPTMDQSSQNDHMHPARSPSEIVRSPFTTEAQSIMPAQVSAQAHESSAEAEIAMHRQGMLLANNERPYQYLKSELTQPSRTFSAQSNMPTQVETQTRLLREPTEAELAPHRKTVNSMWKSAFPVENKSS